MQDWRTPVDAYSLYVASICLAELNRPDEGREMFDTARSLDTSAEPVLIEIRRRAKARVSAVPSDQPEQPAASAGKPQRGESQ